MYEFTQPNKQPKTIRITTDNRYGLDDPKYFDTEDYIEDSEDSYDSEEYDN